MYIYIYIYKEKRAERNRIPKTRDSIITVMQIYHCVKCIDEYVQ